MIYWTLKTHDGSLAPPSYSDFGDHLRCPQVDLVHVEFAWGDSACADSTVLLTPGVWNAGLAEADSVVLRLRPTGGSLTLIDSLVVFTDLPSLSLGDDDAWVLCGEPADTTGFAATIVVEVYQDGGLLRINESQWDGSVGGGPICQITNLRAEAQDSGWMLRWDMSSTCPFEQTVVQIGNYLNTETYDWFAVVPADAAYYEVDAGNLTAPLYSNEFAVRLVVNGYPRPPVTIRMYEGAAVRDGWPRRLPGTSLSSPLVVDLDAYGVDDRGVAIFAATDKIYGIVGSDVSPVDPDQTDQTNFLFFDPALGEPEFGRQFIDAMAFGDWHPDPGPEIAANLFKDGLYMIGLGENAENECCVAEERWMIDLSEATGLDVEAPSPVVAITLEDGEETTSILFLAASNDRYVYAWEGDQTPYGNSLGQFFDIGHIDNPDALAIGYRTDDPGTTGIDESGYELVVATSKGKVHFVPISATNPGALVSARGTWDSGTEVRLSTPAVGDVTGDGNNDVVVTARGGTIYLLDENEATLLDSATNSAWYFEGEDSTSPPVGAALADVDEDGDLEIFVFAATAGVGGAEDYTRALEQTMIRFDWDGTELDAQGASDAVPFSQRTFSTSVPVSTPVIGEVDAEGDVFRADVLANASSGAVFGFEVNGQYFYSKDAGTNGWPLLHESTIRGLTLAAMLPQVEPEQASLVGMGEDGRVHVYDFAMQGSTPPDAIFLWPSEGFDHGNTRGNLSFGGSPRPERVPTALSVRHRPGAPGVVFAVGSEDPGSVTVRVFDVAGRLVDRLDREVTTAGPVEIVWEGVTRGGASLPSGIYLYSVSLSNNTTPLGSGKLALVR